MSRLRGEASGSGDLAAATGAVALAGETVAEPLWTPSAERIAASALRAFGERVGRPCSSAEDYAALWRWSLDEPAAFWAALWRFTEVRGEAGERVLAEAGRMPGARFFPEARLCFAENLLRREDAAPALICRSEDGRRRVLSFAELHAEVSRLAQALADAGVGAGDRVAALLPNVPEAVVGLLATSSLGAIWSSCSPDFGVQGVLDRFGQIAPKVLLAADGWLYAGKRHDALGKLREIAAGLPGLARTVVVPCVRERPPLDGLSRALGWPELLERFPARPLAFTRRPFSHPLAILYSSGTTGPPKCIVHSAGGALLQHLKEHRLHCDVRRDDRVFYFTTTSWMMWNWLVSALGSEASLVLYDGSPFHPGPATLFDLADAEGVTLFGTSAKFLDAAAKAGLEPARSHALSSVRTITSTGSPLAPEGFDYVHERVKRDVHLASISGGTDILGCFVGGVPVAPVWRGEIQGPCLGMAVDVFDEQGRPLRGGPGELVCTRPFPSLPVGFWNDPGGTRYRAAYFERFPGVWCHGDWAEWTAHGGLVILGRSDAVLNPGGVRIGTAEIYRVVEQEDAVLESLVIGQRWQGDERVVLFVRLREGVALDPTLEGALRQRIRSELTPRHVPARIVQVADIPRTRSGKIVELAVRDVVNGRPVRQREALANPEALDLFAELPQLRE
jgi:acetoacetyl-CoA synthetase